ncbi:MAG: hypothetical protein CVV64_06900 [Candidatus Wallbacteria bacterium HGW-Wallbacteria-1]|uniref:Uncharacterized protein n=1 Tax=Candidatus Wallbacteria bacterium HGW-Wallbacteria-1 TaxID=2013854 RepID=A0A2N1PT08_9BACT|nr:MAG: hypothetical protein CVV64_06900 [Candidatus Wallbacteria bacterium HGW-Wallbacteria-1]
MVEKKMDSEVETTDVVKMTCPKDAMNYDLSATYCKGDKIFHELWEDVGVVEETGVTEDGCKKMVVRFEKNGKKKLIMEFTAK